MRTFATPWRVIAVLDAAAALAALLLVLSDDRGARLMLGVVVAVLLVASTRDIALRPTLTVGPDGLRVWRGFRRTLIVWGDLESVSATSHRRRFVGSRWLELDIGDEIVAVAAYRLGVPLDSVVAAVTAARP